MHAVQAVLIVVLAAVAVPVTGVIPVAVVAYVHLPPRKKQHSKELHSAWQLQKKEVDAVEMLRQGVDIAGSIINTKTDRYSKKTYILYL
ncbi:hypothetical protein [Sediminibacterium goheungense]|uniref:Uncharacterized protein n=1 Tax=Sediminibacterium goheungense TaxID=1086393 RepID=A0A4R6IT99_9BACT|nr:hypothetical protein [Sediminibacterium goheungense]TDO25750.1 hypothetical protein BC659_2673 [Sediminibacterium goheungense]